MTKLLPTVKESKDLSSDIEVPTECLMDRLMAICPDAIRDMFSERPPVYKSFLYEDNETVDESEDLFDIPCKRKHRSAVQSSDVSNALDSENDL